MSTETDRVTLTQRCADAEHERCAGFSGGPGFPCLCACHPTYSHEEYALLIVRQAMRQARDIPRISFDADKLAVNLVRDLRAGGVL